MKKDFNVVFYNGKHYIVCDTLIDGKIFYETLSSNKKQFLEPNSCILLKKIYDIKDLNGITAGKFTIVIDKDTLAITLRTQSKDMIIYTNSLNNVSDIIKDIVNFGFESCVLIKNIVVENNIVGVEACGAKYYFKGKEELYYYCKNNKEKFLLLNTIDNIADSLHENANGVSLSEIYEGIHMFLSPKLNELKKMNIKDLENYANLSKKDKIDGGCDNEHFFDINSKQNPFIKEQAQSHSKILSPLLFDPNYINSTYVNSLFKNAEEQQDAVLKALEELDILRQAIDNSECDIKDNRNENDKNKDISFNRKTMLMDLENLIDKHNNIKYNPIIPFDIDNDDTIDNYAKNVIDGMLKKIKENYVFNICPKKL